jgi:hypothetical protein
MSELPRTDDLPRSDDGFDPARVEEAFASFAERVHELESVAVELRAELRELRAERRTERGQSSYADVDEDWPEDAAFAGRGLAPSPDWVAALPPPLLRPFAVPRLALEGGFLLVVALLAGLADLEAAWIVLVMASAWALVALSEWTAAAKRARWRLDEIAPAVAPEGGAEGESTGPWSMPVVESTAVAIADDSESRTVIATLPTDPEAESPDEPTEPEPESQPTRRRFRLLRRRAAAPDAPDPWEQ